MNDKLEAIKDKLVDYIEDHGGCGCCSSSPDMEIINSYIDLLIEEAKTILLDT